MLKNKGSSNMAQTFGNFVEDESSSPEHLVIGFSSNSIPLKQWWRNNGLSASFIADFLTPFFPIAEDEPNALKQRDRVIGAVRYIDNELLDNAVKFSDETSQYPISIKLDIKRDRLIVRTTNAIDPQRIITFQGELQLSGMDEYAPIMTLLDEVVNQEPPVLTLDLRELEFLNSSGVNVLLRLVIKVREKQTMPLVVQGSENLFWQSRSLNNIKRLMPTAQLNFT